MSENSNNNNAQESNNNNAQESNNNNAQESNNNNAQESNNNNAQENNKNQENNQDNATIEEILHDYMSDDDEPTPTPAPTKKKLTKRSQFYDNEAEEDNSLDGDDNDDDNDNDDEPCKKKRAHHHHNNDDSEDNDSEDDTLAAIQKSMPGFKYEARAMCNYPDAKCGVTAKKGFDLCPRHQKMLEEQDGKEAARQEKLAFKKATSIMRMKENERALMDSKKRALTIDNMFNNLVSKKLKAK